MGPSIAPLAWPSLPNQPWTWAMARDYLRHLGGTGEPTTKAGVMSGWLALHCEWVTGSGLPVPTGALDEDTAFDGTLDAALERMADDNRWREWLLQIFPVLCAPAHDLSDETKYSILCRLVEQARRPGEWNAGVKSWKVLYGDASKEASSRTGHLTPQQIGEVRDTDPWACLERLAGYGNWYDTPVDRHTSFADLLERSVSSSLWPKSYLTQLLALDLPGKDRASRGRMVTHWGTRSLDATLADPRERLRFIRTLGGICESAPQRLLHVFVESWRALVRLHRLADEIGDWFDVTQSEGNLIWHGPRAIRLIPRLGEPLRMGELVVRRVEGWSVTSVDLPDALVGWLGIMQTLGFKQTRPDARFEAWVSPPSDLAVFDGDEWSLPPVDTWHRMEALAAAWNKAIDQAQGPRRGDAASVNFLKLRWLGLLRMHLTSDGVLLTVDDWFLRPLHVESGDILQLKQNILQVVRSGQYHQCFSWLRSLASHEPLHRAWQWDRVALDLEGITTHIRNLPSTIDRLIGRTDVSEALGDTYADGPPASPAEVIDRVREKLGDAFTPYVERRLRDYFTVLPE